MSNEYDHAEIEARWQRYWDEHDSFRARNPGEPGFDPAQPKSYVLDMFPYPSGSGLHVGHLVGYIGTDIIARRRRMDGCNVLHPMGWDAFGLPAEQYAIQTGRHPAETTRSNVATYRRQLRQIGLSYDWSRELNTSDPAYYRWTQWIFARLFDRGLAYQSEVPVWWCEDLKTVLANEEVINGRSERGNFPCVRRPLKQWMLRITAYADRLVDDLDTLDWPESIKAMQREWIGRSQGAEIGFPLESLPGEKIAVFTTRPDTLFGATFLVLAPEHPLVARLTTPEQRARVEAYAAEAATRSDRDRSDVAREKTGVFTGSYAVNPLAPAGSPAARLPVWIADYVLATYGTGAIMAVPAHDERDFDFAGKMGLPVREVVRPPAGTPGLAEGVCFTGDGTAVSSPPIDGLPTPQAKQKIVERLEAAGAGRARTTYRLRDWLFSRQRYWGEPFPVLHLAAGETLRVPDEALPVTLPEMHDFAPSADGAPPLARARDWVETTHPVSGEKARRDTDTMPGWAGSCWYFLRFMDPHNPTAPFSPEAERYWGPVDLYVGGATHAVLHLLYARFWHKVLFDLGVVHTSEPFQRLFNQGMLCAPAYKDSTERYVPADEVEERDGRYYRKGRDEEVFQFLGAMGKSLRNVVNPDDVIREHGADTMRLYEMFMAPLDDQRIWEARSIPGCRRFLERVWRLIVDPEGTAPCRPELAPGAAEPPLEGGALEIERALHRAIKRVDHSFGPLNFNTAIAALMSFLNEVARHPGQLGRAQAERLVLVLAPFAPHLAEELWARLGHEESIARAPWPRVEEKWLVEETYELVVQVLGKVRGHAIVARDAAEADLLAAARAAVARQLEGKTLVKTIVLPGKLVNFVVR